MRFLTYNVQAGIGTRGATDYIFKAHHQVIDTAQKQRTLKNIGMFIKDFDIVCLQEVDLGGRRAGYKSQVEYLQKISELPYAIDQTNRIVGRSSRHGNAILSRYPIENIVDHKLPSRIPGRGKLMCEISGHTIINTHLSLRDKVQAEQLAFISSALANNSRIIMCGDLNCRAAAPHLRTFADANDLNIITGQHTVSYPSWAPRRDLDHILVSQSLGHVKADTIDVRYSDHLPVQMDIDSDLFE